ncbi:import inner membrane translocase subunit tim-21, mitochondrial [Jackrogersella minutella]|nr:import inner membrane translocase subunit tim-21, mitochondrial [Jackrogersella minutella]
MMKLVVRPFNASAILPRLQPILLRRGYATHHGLGDYSGTSKRKTVTVFSDDGLVPWRHLSAGEKAARATQQTFNFGLVIIGVVLTGAIGMILFEDVFAPESKTAYFSRTFDRVRNDPECVALLGDRKKITAHGEETTSKWRRARPIATSLQTDGQGTQHMIMKFYVEGPLNNGVVHAHLTKRRSQDVYEYKYFYVDIRGQRIDLEKADTKSSSGKNKKFKLFGVSWN